MKWKNKNLVALAVLAVFAVLFSAVDSYVAAPAKAQVTSTRYLNGKILFDSTRDEPHADIYSMLPNGTGITNLTNTNTVAEWGGSWSPDGSKIAFTGERDDPGNNDIYVMDADGSNVTRLTTDPAYEDYPDWSPDGSKITFDSGRAGDYETWIMDADGSNQQKLINGTNSSWGAVWSPDGTKIAFTSDRLSDSDIFTMNSDGSNVQRLTIGSNVSYPKWSPDGTKLTYYSDAAGGNTDIYVMNADGSNNIRLTTDPIYENMPAWSPDGAKIIFDKQHANTNKEIHAMNTDGSGITNLTDTGYTIYNSIYAANPWLGQPYTVMTADDGTTYSVISSDKDYSTTDYTVQPDEVLTLDGNLCNVIVSSGATLKGSGSACTIQVATDGTIAPGHSPGCISSGDLSLSGSYVAEIAGNQSCSGYDQLKVTGTVTLNGTLNTQLLNSFIPTTGDSFTLIENDSTDPVMGTFAGLAEGSTFTIGRVMFTISYIGGDGNDVTLRAQTLPDLPKTGVSPQPTNTYAFWLLGSAGIILSLLSARKLRSLRN